MNKLQNYIKNNNRDFIAPKEMLDKKQTANPFKLFEHCMEIAVKHKIPTANCMQISTVSEFGYPSSRIVFLREYDNKGFIFYSNYNSRKGKDIAANDQISALFFWVELECQIRIEGKAEQISEKQSDEYFADRPRESQLNAWASHQSQPIESRNDLLEKMKYYKDKFKDMDIPRPNHWGGYILIPQQFEFWMAKHQRLHDRLIYERIKDKDEWERYFIAP